MQPTANTTANTTSFPDASNPNGQVSPFAAAAPPLPQQSPNIANANSTLPSPVTTVNQTQQNNNAPTVTTTSGNTNSGGGKRRRVVMIGIVVLLMLAGLASGTYLLRQRQLEPSFAWDCTLYRFEVDQSGSVTALNGSLRDLPAQQADVYVDGQLVATFDVPALDSGDSASLGVVTVPVDGKFDWQVVGNKDCEHTGSYSPESIAQCLTVKAFDENWEPLAPQDLSELQEGDIVRFTIGGLTNKGTFEMARFTINGELTEPVTDKRPGTDEFYYEYEIPEDIEDFTIDADLMHSEAGWI